MGNNNAVSISKNLALEWVYLGNNSAPTLFPAFLTYSSFAFLLAQILTILTSHIMWVSGIDPIISYFCLNCKQASWLGLGGGPQLSLVTCHLPLATCHQQIWNPFAKKKKLSFWWFLATCLFIHLRKYETRSHEHWGLCH